MIKAIGHLVFFLLSAQLLSFIHRGVKKAQTWLRNRPKTDKRYGI